MNQHPLKSRLGRNEVLFGLAVTCPCPPLIEALGPGYDWLWVDAQHGLWDRATDMLKEFFEDKTIGDLAEEVREQQSARAPNYQI